MKTINSDSAPEAIGPYSHAAIHGSTAYLSGQIPLNPKTLEIEARDITGQTEQVFDNIEAVLSALGCRLDQVVKTTVFLKQMADFPEMNKVYGARFKNHRPARSTIGVAALPKDARVEIECVVEIR